MRYPEVSTMNPKMSCQVMAVRYIKNEYISPTAPTAMLQQAANSRILLGRSGAIFTRRVPVT